MKQTIRYNKHHCISQKPGMTMTMFAMIMTMAGRYLVRFPYCHEASGLGKLTLGSSHPQAGKATKTMFAMIVTMAGHHPPIPGVPLGPWRPLAT